MKTTYDEQYIYQIEQNNIISKTDINGTITFVSDEFCKIFGYKKDELIGKSHNIVRHPDVKNEVFKKLWDTILEKKTYKATVKNLTKDNKTLYLNTTIFPILDDSGQIVEFVAMRYDVTDAVKKAKMEKIIYSQARLTSLGEMIGNIAHQWRQPLNNLNIVLYKIKKAFSGNEESFYDEYKEALAITKEMSKTIDDFSNFFRPEKEKSCFYLSAVIERARAIMNEMLKREGIDISYDVSENLKIYGYANELSHVLINIINNAKDAFLGKKNKKIIKIKTQKIIDTDNQEWIEINILDNAGGIKKDIIQKIFEPYFTTKHKSCGTGIGLYMCKQIIEYSMQGQIFAQNQNGGAMFIIRLKECR